MSDGPVKDSTVNLRNNIGTASIVRDDNEGPKIAGTHFPFERLLDCGVANEDKVPGFEVVISDGPGVLLLESTSRFVPCFENRRMKKLEVFVVLL